MIWLLICGLSSDLHFGLGIIAARQSHELLPFPQHDLSKCGSGYAQTQTTDYSPLPQGQCSGILFILTPHSLSSLLHLSPYDEFMRL